MIYPTFGPQRNKNGHHHLYLWIIFIVGIIILQRVLNFQQDMDLLSITMEQKQAGKEFEETQKKLNEVLRGVA